MRKKYDVIVIGSGIGGSVCAALLAHENLKVLLLEKNPKIGGACSYYKKDGFHVDIGTHLFSRGNKGPIGSIQSRLGITDRINFIRPRDIALMKGQGFHLLLPSQAYRMPKFFVDLIRQFRIPLREIPPVLKLFYDLSTMPEERIREWDRWTVDEFISRYTRNPRVAGYLGFILGLFFVFPLWEVSAGESIWCYKQLFLNNSLGYPEGGAVAVPMKFVDSAKRSGASVLTNSKAIKISIRDNAVRGVVLEDGHRFSGKTVVSTTSLFDSVFGLVGEQYFPPKYLKKIKGIQRSYIAVQAKIALKKKLFYEGCLMGFAIPGRSKNIIDYDINDLCKGYQDVSEGRVPEVVPVYCPSPTNFDPNLAPEGRQLLTACTVAPTTDIQLKDPPETWIDCLMKSLGELIPGLNENILWYDTFTVSDIEEWIGKTYGPAITTAQTPEQVGHLRPSIRTPIKGLYFAGDCAGGRGIGTELAARSGMECTDMILSDVKNYLI